VPGKGTLDRVAASGPVATRGAPAATKPPVTVTDTTAQGFAEREFPVDGGDHDGQLIGPAAMGNSRMGSGQCPASVSVYMSYYNGLYVSGRCFFKAVQTLGRYR